MDLPKEMPVMTLQQATLFPQALLPLYIFEPRYRRMLRDALETHRMFTVAMQRPDRKRETPATVGGLGLIRVSVNHEDGTSHLVLQGLARVEIGSAVSYKPYRMHEIRPLEAAIGDSVTIDALVAKVHELVSQRIEKGPSPLPFKDVKKSGKKNQFSAKDVLGYLENLPSAEQVADLVSCALLTNPTDRQIILETVDLEMRLKRLIHFLLAEIQSSPNL